MKFLIREKQFYTGMLALALPIAGQNMITFAISMMDTIMVGQLGEVQLAAAAIANQFSYVFMVLTFGVGSGANVLIAQYWGKKDVASMRSAISIMYRCTLVGASLFVAIALFFPGWVMGLFSDDPEVIAYGISYLKVLGVGFLFSGFTNTTLIMLRSVGTVRISLAVYTASLISNTTLNYILIFGKLGFPAMGIVGAAIATVISRMIEAGIVVYFLCRYEDKIGYRFRSLFKGTGGMFKQYAVTGLPVILNELLWASGAAVVSAIIGKLGTPFMAANSICMVMTQLVTVMIYGVSTATATIVGNTVGGGEYDRARQTGRTMMLMAILLGVLSSLIMLSLRGAAVSLYNVSELTKAYAMQIMGVHALIVVFQSMANMGLVGVLRGGADTRFVLIVDVVFMWTFAIPLGWFVGHRLGAAIPLVYFCLKADELIKSVIASARIFRGKWVKDVTKMEPAS